MSRASEYMNASNQNIGFGSLDNIQQDENLESDIHGEDLSFHHRAPLDLDNIDWNDLTDVIRALDSGPMDEQSRALARHHKQNLLSIRHKLKRNNAVIRGSYRGNSLHTYRANDFHRKAAFYMAQIGIYSLIRKLNGRHPEHITQSCLINIVDRVETTLDDLYRSGSLNEFKLTCMELDRAQVQLNYLYFVPETGLVCLLSTTLYLLFYRSLSIGGNITSTHCGL